MKIPQNENKVDLGSVAEVPLGQGRCFIVDQKEIAVFRTRNGELHALANKCAHKQGPLSEGLCDFEKVVCPYHGHTFNLKTGVGGVAGEQVEVFSVIEEDEKIILQI